MAFKDLFKNTGRTEKETNPEDKRQEHSSMEGRQDAVAERQKLDPGSTTAADLYPFGLGKYHQTAPDTDALHVCDSHVLCPVCGKEITVVRPLTANLHLKYMDDDLRRHYKDFEPIWYDVWCCPHCYYSALYSDFDSNKENISYYAEDIKTAMRPYLDHKMLQFSVPRRVEESITSMYLAIRCADFYDCNPLVLAKIWLHLSWIYKDLEDEKAFLKATEKALESYKRMYYEAREDFAPVVEQTCFLVMGELNIRLKKYKDAYECLTHSKMVKEGNRLHKMNAQNRIDEVRELMQEEKK